MNITIDIPKKITLKIFSNNNSSLLEPQVCPDILDYQYQDLLSILLGNITLQPISIKKGQQIAKATLVSINSYTGIYMFEFYADMGLNKINLEQ